MLRLQYETSNPIIYTVEDRIPSGSLTGTYNLILTNCQSHATASVTIWDISTYPERYNKSTITCPSILSEINTTGNTAIAGNQLICVEGNITIDKGNTLFIGTNTVILYTGTLTGTTTGSGSAVHVSSIPLSYNINTISGSYFIDLPSGYYDYSITDSNGLELEIGNLLMGPTSQTTSSYAVTESRNVYYNG